MYGVQKREKKGDFMAKMKIHCRSCGKSWKITERDKWNNDNARICPHCFKKIDCQTWKNDILPAFGAFMDLNKQLIKDTGAGCTLFSVDFKS